MVKYAECPVCEEVIKNTSPLYKSKIPVIMLHIMRTHKELNQFIVDRDNYLIRERIGR